MAKFSVKITMSDGELIDDVSAIFDDQTISNMISACERKGYLDSAGQIIKGGRAVTYAVRAFLTEEVKKDLITYGKAAVEQQITSQISAVDSAIEIEDNMPIPVVPDQPQE